MRLWYLWARAEVRPALPSHCILHLPSFKISISNRNWCLNSESVVFSLEEPCGKSVGAVLFRLAPIGLGSAFSALLFRYDRLMKRYGRVGRPWTQLTEVENFNESQTSPFLDEPASPENCWFPRTSER